MSESGVAQSGASGRAFRTDIEGLRALAVLAVLGYHAQVPGFSGGFVGVDVFFVISGFLITGILFSEIARTGAVNLANFFARRARRLLPASALVLVVTAIAGRFVLAPVDHPMVAGDLAAAALYAVNLRMAWQSADYLAGDRDGSPVLHYWSLAVEEQFYLLWPLLLLALLVWLPRGRGRAGGATSHSALRVFLFACCAISFALALWLTDRAQPWSFFSPWTRAWEFAAGALVFAWRDALLRLSGRAAAALGWAGLAALALAVARTSEAGFPGVSAWLPVLGTAAMIAAGARGAFSPGQLGALLSLAPLRLIGRLSYSLYLWHWPVVVYAIHAFGPMHWSQKLAWTLASAVPAALAWRFVEKPVHEGRIGAAKRPATGAWIGAGASCSGLIAAAWLAGPMLWSAPSPASSESDAPPALEVQIAAVREDLPAVYRDGCHLSIQATASPPCVYGRADGAPRVVLFGDSKAAQWFPALEAIARERGWRLESLTKSGCPAPEVALWSKNLAREYRECGQWREEIFARLARERPDLVIVASVFPGRVFDSALRKEADAERSRTLWQEGWTRSLARLRRAGLGATLLIDTPTAQQDMASCVSAHLKNPEACNLPPPAQVIAALEREAAQSTGIPVIDLSDRYCRSGSCPAVIDEILVYRDKTHFTPAFVRHLAPALAERLDALRVLP